MFKVDAQVYGHFVVRRFVSGVCLSACMGLGFEFTTLYLTESLEHLLLSYCELRDKNAKNNPEVGSKWSVCSMQ